MDADPFFFCEGLVDLPGYGYAKAPKAVVSGWGQTVTEYVTNRSTEVACVCVCVCCVCE
jgi:GTP-binding protein EngB required for normal cell division